MLLALLLAIAVDPVIGTWDLDVAKSSFDPGPPLKSQTRVYAETADGLKMTLSGVSASGTAMHVEYTARDDGSDYALTGSPSVNTVSIRHVDRLHADAIEKKDGVAKFHVTREISADERTMIVTSVGTNAKGTAIRNVLVFHRR